MLRALWPLLAFTLAAQTPWDVLGSRTVPIPFVGSSGASRILAPSGDVFLGFNPCGASTPILVTNTYGQPAACDTVIARVNPAGQIVFAIQLAGVDDLNPVLLADPQGNLLVGGYTDYGSRFLPTPGAYLATPSQTTTASGFACKLAVSNGTPMFCTFLDVSAEIRGLDTSGNLVFTQIQSSLYTIRELDPTGAKLALASIPITNSVDELVANTDGTFWVTTHGPAPNGDAQASPSFFGKFSPNQGFLFQESVPLGFAISMQPGVGPIVSGAIQPGFEVRQYAADGQTLIYDRTLPYYNGGTLSVVNGGVILVGLAAITAPLLHNLHPCGQNQVQNSLQNTLLDSLMTRLDATGTIIQSTWLGSNSFSQLLLTSNSGWSALGSTFPPPAFAIQVVNIGPSPGTPLVPIGCMTDVAQHQQFVASPGLLVTLTVENDSNTAPATAQPNASGTYPTSLAGMTLTFDGVPAPLFAFDGVNLKAAVPFSVAGKSTTEMCLNQSCTHISAAPFAPVIFPTVVNQDGSLNSSTNPAQTGSVVTFFLLGLGPLTPAVGDGTIITTPLPLLTAPVTVQFATGFPVGFIPTTPPVTAQVTYAGPAPFEVAGVYQVNVIVPATALGQVIISLGPSGGVAAEPLGFHLAN
jgi:uncharacterized protein (TIGR03437 family)